MHIASIAVFAEELPFLVFEEQEAVGYAGVAGD